MSERDESFERPDFPAWLPEDGARAPSPEERAADEALGEALRSAYAPHPLDPKRKTARERRTDPRLKVGKGGA